MEFANYFFIRALEQGWEILKTRDASLWDSIFPPSIPVPERRRARDLIIKTDIQFRLTYSVGITNENTNVVSTGLDGSQTVDHSPFLLNVQQDGRAWAMDRGTVTIYIVTYNEFLMMTLANIIRTILNSFIVDGWFTRAGFDFVRRASSNDLRVETGNMPENVTKYIRQQVWECSNSTYLPHIEGPFDFPTKPIFVADDTVECDSILDPTTGNEYELGETYRGGVTPVP